MLLGPSNALEKCSSNALGQGHEPSRCEMARARHSVGQQRLVVCRAFVHLPHK